MIDKKLKYKNIKGQKHMLAYITPSEARQLEKLGGQKTMTKEGVPAYPPGEKYGGKDSSGNFNDPTPSSPSGKSSNASNTNPNYSGGNANTGTITRATNSGYRGPSELGATTRAVNPVDISPVDRSAVSQFSTFGRNTMNQNLKGPTLGERIGSGISNIGDMAGNYIKSGGIFGMGVRGLDSLFGKIFGPRQTPRGDALPVIKTDASETLDNNEGIMAAYNPYILPVEEEKKVSEEDDLLLRFLGADSTL
jgi:hypothetical protein